MIDGHGRLVRVREPNGPPAPHLVIAESDDGHVAAIGAQVPHVLARELEATARESGPAAIARCRELLEDSLGATTLETGPTYVVPVGVAFSSGVPVVVSVAPHAKEWMRGSNPKGGGWSAEDWEALVDGALGPWAMAVVDDQVISMCHTSRLADHGAEAGVWTAPEFRGQGHAAAVTAAWASLFAGTRRRLFYSTSADNLSSQRVAARLGLDLIGWRWQLSAVPDQA